MILLAVVLAMLLQLLWPLPWPAQARRLLQRWAERAARWLDTGQSRHAWLGWVMAVLGPAVLVAGVHGLLRQGSSLLAAAWMAAVLFLALGLRPLGQYFVGIRDALAAGQDGLAQRLLARWRQVPVRSVPAERVLPLTLEQTVLTAYRDGFGVLAWFVLLALLGLGPAGAVLYRQAQWVARHWPHASQQDEPGVSQALNQCAQRNWQAVDWLPARLTALGLALAGRFEDALQGWRQQAAQPAGTAEQLVLASAAGAIGVQLGAHGEGSGELPGLAHFARVAGLLWRLLALWLLVLVLLTLARLA